MMNTLKQVVEALGREINRLSAKQNPPGTPPLVPLPPQGDRNDGRAASRGEAFGSLQEREEPFGHGCGQDEA